jgi:general secretion pathway protein D
MCVLAFLGVLFVGVLSAAPIAEPLPADIAARLAARAAKARKANLNLRAYLLYKEAANLDPMNGNYRENRDSLEVFAKALQQQKMETADIQPDIAACKLEATPGSDSSIAARLADRAEQARRAGETVHAYFLYAAAASRYPDNPDYRENRNVLAPLATQLRSSQPDASDISTDIKAAELESLGGRNPSIEVADTDWKSDNSLAGLPRVVFSPVHHDLDLKGDRAKLIQEVTSTYGVRAITDPELPKSGSFSLKITDADFHTALEALTSVTDTFVFPVSPQVVFFATDTEAKRNDLEPNILLTVALPDSLNDKDLIDVANGVKSVLNLKNFGWDSVNRVVIIRDRFTKAHVAKSLLESLLVPHSQVALELQFITVDSDIVHEWGFSPQTSFNLLSPLTKLFNFNTTNLSTLASSIEAGAHYIAVGAGAGLFGISVTSAEIFATYSKSITNTIYDATVVVDDGQTANLHVGEKYPIPTSLYTGASSATPSIYNPIGSFTQEDLGLALKVTPHVKGNGEVAMEIEAEYKALGTETLNTVPSINQRKFTGSVVLEPDQWAVLAGLDSSDLTRSRSGLAGLSDIPGLNQILSQNNREKQTSETLVVLKPIVKRLPMSDAISPQFLIGAMRGARVLL